MQIKKALAIILSAIVLLSMFPISAFAAAPLDGYPGIDDLPAINTIPDPFAFFDADNDPNSDGYVSTPDEWSARRDEIKDLVQHYWLGYQWPTAPEDVIGNRSTISIPNEDFLGGFFGMGGELVNYKNEFTKLVNLLKTNAVEIYEVIPGMWGMTSLGGLKYTFGPASDPTDEAAVEALAFQTWNAGYYLTINGAFGPVHAVLSDYTGILSEAPPETRLRTDDTITVRNPANNVTESFIISVDMPTAAQRLAAWGSADAKVPFVIDIGGASAFSAANLNAQGYARVTFTPGSIYNDSTTKPITRTGIYVNLYPYDKDEYEYASGALLAWSWATSQIITAMEQPMTDSEMTYGDFLGLDPAKTVVTGHSRYGKSAMFAAAFDERISICIPSEPGGSGIQSYRYKAEGKIFNWNTGYYPKADRVYGKTENPTVSYGSGNTWFPDTAAMFVDKDNQIPFDSSDIIALVAPRPFFVVSGIDSHWLGNEGGVAAVVAASEVYNYIGKNEIEKNNAAVRVRESDHVFYNRDFCYALAIMDREFKQGTDDQELHVQDLFPTGTGISGMSYPAEDYDTVSEFNSYPFEINSSYLPWSSANKYTLWTAQENFLINRDVAITAHSDAPDVALFLPGSETGIEASEHNGDTFIFNLTSEQAVYGRYELRTEGNDKDNRSVFFAAVSLADALRHGSTKGDEGEENRVIGFSSRLANNADDLPLVYVTGDAEPLAMSLTPSRFKAEETTLMEYGIQFHDPLFVRVANNGWIRDDDHTFRIENLKFVTIPDYTFQFSMGDIAAAAGNSGKDLAAQFTKPISWNVERYNNGAAKDGIWPPIPDTLAERNILTDGGIVERPIAPSPKSTNFKAQITDIKAASGASTTDIVVSFSEALKKGELAFGLNVADKWTTSWNDEGTQLTISIANDDLNGDVSDCSVIFFRLMDVDGNLIGGPVEKSVSLPEAVGLTVSSNKNLVMSNEYFDITASFNEAVSSNAAVVSVVYDSDIFTYAGNLGVDGVTYVNTVNEAGLTKLTLMISGYNALDLINLRFQTNDELDKADSVIEVKADYVYKDDAGEKSIKSVSASRTISIAPPIPDDIDLIYLSNLIDLFGTSKDDELWSTAKYFDFNGNGEIDISDITYVAQLIK